MRESCMCLSKDPGEIMPHLPTKVTNLRIHLGAVQRKTSELCKVSSLEYSVEYRLVPEYKETIRARERIT